jgi:hypothetical protein
MPIGQFRLARNNEGSLQDYFNYFGDDQIYQLLKRKRELRTWIIEDYGLYRMCLDDAQTPGGGGMDEAFENQIAADPDLQKGSEFDGAIKQVLDLNNGVISRGNNEPAGGDFPLDEGQFQHFIRIVLDHSIIKIKRIEYIRLSNPIPIADNERFDMKEGTIYCELANDLSDERKKKVSHAKEMLWLA